MDQKKSTDIVAAAPGMSPMSRRRESWLERDFDTIFDDFRRSFDVMLSPYFPLETRMQELGPPNAPPDGPSPFRWGGEIPEGWTLWKEELSPYRRVLRLVK